MKFTINSIDILNYVSTNVDLLIDYSPKLITAFFILIVGHYTIKLIQKVLNLKIKKREYEPTLSKFLVNILLWALRVLLFVTFISKLGIETASFVAIIGAAGLAIGLSLQGSLSNFAGGILIILFKPFEVNDIIEAQGVSGEVLEIQIFVTKLLSSNNKVLFIPNGTLSNGIITNHSKESFSKIEIQITISYQSNIKEVKGKISSIIQDNKNVFQIPKPVIEVIELNDSGVKLAIKIFANNEQIATVRSEILEAIKNPSTL